MNIWLSRWLLIFGLVVAGQTNVFAVTYIASMNQAQWKLELSKFECKMWQPIPFFGEAVFARQAGEKQRFFLSPETQEMRKGKASLISSAPVWDSSRQAVNLGYVGVDATQSVKLGRTLAFRLLNELYDGMSPVFTRTSWYAKSEKIKVGLSSINFRKAYAKYQQCLTALLPVNFDQIRRTRIHFATGKSELTPLSKQRLDHIVEYVQVDTTISGFYIDGHTDSVGRRLYNLDLSKSRAEAVSKYLTAKGIDEAAITTRYHGERYPVVNNKTRKNRAANRRVTVRLERDGV